VLVHLEEEEHLGLVRDRRPEVLPHLPPAPQTQRAGSVRVERKAWNSDAGLC
jgi:hypothetical protein